MAGKPSLIAPADKEKAIAAHNLAKLGGAVICALKALDGNVLSLGLQKLLDMQTVPQTFAKRVRDKYAGYKYDGDVLKKRRDAFIQHIASATTT